MADEGAGADEEGRTAKRRRRTPPRAAAFAQAAVEATALAARRRRGHTRPRVALLTNGPSTRHEYPPPAGQSGTALLSPQDGAARLPPHGAARLHDELHRHERAVAIDRHVVPTGAGGGT
eukprot:COSAG01_NODE_2397_length_7771_cov_12.578076_9_plen_120_part_00